MKLIHCKFLYFYGKYKDVKIECIYIICKVHKLLHIFLSRFIIFKEIYEYKKILIYINIRNLEINYSIHFK